MGSRFLGLAMVVTVSILVEQSAAAQGNACTGQGLTGIEGLQAGRVLADGTLVGKAKLNINIDGYGRAYHPTNAAAGALIHLCNAGQVFSSNGERYHGSRDNKTCTGRFMTDFQRIGAAGWRNPAVGVIRWYGILGQGSIRMGKRRVAGVTPVLQSDGSGFYVSPTSLVDATIADPRSQHRYVHPLRVSAAVIPSSDKLRDMGVVLGSFGAVLDPASGRSVAFIVGDGGPRIGEGTPALARQLAGRPLKDPITRAERYIGQVDSPRLIWVFFGKQGGRTTYDSRNPATANQKAAQAFVRWGGPARLLRCL